MIAALAAAFFSIVPVASAQVSGPDLIVRLERLENQIRVLTGAVEQLQFRNQQLEQQLKRSQDEALARTSPQLKPLDKRVLLHAHCHQKAFGAVKPILQVLKLIPGVEPELIESSCCGMAGSFGYEASHYDVSMQMAEAHLLPAVRKYPGAIVVADGTS